LFTFNGHLITCNPAARQVFGKTIWLQSDIFGMGERERRGLNLDEIPAWGASFRIHRTLERTERLCIERTERRSAYESMMDALAEPKSSYEVDLPIRNKAEDGTETSWYCRVLAQRHTDPVTAQPIIMVSHQDVTALRNVEAELGRIQMNEETNKGLMAHDSDVAGSLLTLLGQDWDFLRDTTQKNVQLDNAVECSGDTLVSAADMHLRLASGQMAPESLNLGCNKLSALRTVLQKADEWCFDVFELERETDGVPLQVLCALSHSKLCVHI